MKAAKSKEVYTTLNEQPKGRFIRFQRSVLFAGPSRLGEREGETGQYFHYKNNTIVVTVTPQHPPHTHRRSRYTPMLKGVELKSRIGYAVARSEKKKKREVSAAQSLSHLTIRHTTQVLWRRQSLERETVSTTEERGRGRERLFQAPPVARIVCRKK